MRCQAFFGSLNSMPGNSTTTTRCGHLFHINCINSWLNDGNQTCPRCRSMISRNQLIQLYPETLPRLEGEVQDQQLILWRINFEKIQTISENVPLQGHTGSRPTRATPTGTLPSGIHPTEAVPSGTLLTGSHSTSRAEVLQLNYMSCSEILCFIAGIFVFLFSLVMLLDYAQYYNNNNNQCIILISLILIIITNS